MSRLMLHAGGEHVDLDAVIDATTPPPTKTHYPIPHEFLIDKVVENIDRSGFVGRG